MSCEVQNADARTDEHSDCGSDVENTSHVVDYRLDANMSLTMPTPDHVARQNYDLRVSDDSSCDGDSELSPTPASKRFKADVREEDRATHLYGKGRFCFLIQIVVITNERHRLIAEFLIKSAVSKARCMHLHALYTS